jgi:hypothetical protein
VQVLVVGAPVAIANRGAEMAAVTVSVRDHI